MLSLSGEMILLALLVLWVGSLLVKYAEQISDITGIGQLFIGSFLLAAATSLPELAIDVNAVVDGMPNMAAGDLFGSSLFNLLILGIADLIHQERGAILARTSTKHALAAVLSISVTALAGLAILMTRVSNQFTVAGINGGLIAVAITYLLGTRMSFREAQVANATPNDLLTEKPHHAKLTILLLKYVFCIIALLIIAPRMTEIADKMATLSGLGRTFIGTTLVAAVTSMPEAVSTIVAVRRGAFALAVGNIFGSNAFNMLILLPLDALYPGNLMAEIDVQHLITCLFTIFITTVAISGQLYQVRERHRLLDPDAWMVIGLVISAIATIYFAQGHLVRF
jgi:cation:H+ antiporter